MEVFQLLEVQETLVRDTGAAGQEEQLQVPAAATQRPQTSVRQSWVICGGQGERDSTATCAIEAGCIHGTHSLS